MIARDAVVLGGTGLALAAVAFGLSAALCGLARRWAPRWGLLDRPGGHKGHKEPTPLGGGVAIWMTVVAVLGLAALAIGPRGPRCPRRWPGSPGGPGPSAPVLAEILALATAVMVMGLIDDIRGLGWRLRLAIQVGLAAVLAASGVRVTLFWPFTHPLAGAP